MRTEIQKGERTTQLNLEKLAAGLYVVTIQNFSFDQNASFSGIPLLIIGK